MKVSCLPVSLFPDIISGKMSLEAWLDAAPGLLLDGVDISRHFIQCHSAVYMNNMKKLFASKALPVVMCTTYPDFTHPDPAQRRRELAYLASDIAVCSQLGIPYLRVLAGQKHAATKIDDGIRFAIDCIRRSNDVAQSMGVTLLYEDHAKPGAWEYIDMTYPPELFLRVVDGIRDTSVGINFDIGNITAYGADPLPVLKQVIDKVQTIHVTDMKTKGVFSPVLIGTGVTPIKEVFAYLKQAGFDNWLCIEEASGQGMEGIQKAVINTRRIWESA